MCVRTADADAKAKWLAASAHDCLSIKPHVLAFCVCSRDSLHIFTLLWSAAGCFCLYLYYSVHECSPHTHTDEKCSKSQYSTGRPNTTEHAVRYAIRNAQCSRSAPTSCASCTGQLKSAHILLTAIHEHGRSLLSKAPSGARTLMKRTSHKPHGPPAASAARSDNIRNASVCMCGIHFPGVRRRRRRRCALCFRKFIEHPEAKAAVVVCSILCACVCRA